MSKIKLLQHASEAHDVAVRMIVCSKTMPLVATAGDAEKYKLWKLNYHHHYTDPKKTSFFTLLQTIGDNEKEKVVPAGNLTMPGDFSPFVDSKKFACVSYDSDSDNRYIRVYQINYVDDDESSASSSSSSEIAKLETKFLSGHSSCVECLTWHPTEKQFIVTCSDDKTCRIHDLFHQCTIQIINFEKETTVARFHPVDGKTLVVGYGNFSSNNEIAILEFDSNSSSEKAKTLQLDHQLTEKDVSSNSSKIGEAIGVDSFLHHFQCYDNKLRDFVFLDSGKKVLCCGNDNEAKIHDMNGTELHKFNVGGSGFGAAVDNTERYAIIATGSKDIIIHDLISKKQFRLEGPHEKYRLRAATIPNCYGNKFFVGGAGCELCLYSIPTFELRRKVLLIAEKGLCRLATEGFSIYNVKVNTALFLGSSLEFPDDEESARVDAEGYVRTKKSGKSSSAKKSVSSSSSDDSWSDDY